MQFLTDFADQAVILPLAAAVAVTLAASGWWRGALGWIVAVGGVMGTMGLLKIVFLVCAGPLAGWGIRSPSGHTAASTVVYGGMVLLMARDRLARPVLAAVPLLVAVVFGLSRLVLHAHVPVEVVVGAVVGLIGAAVLLPLAGPQPALRRWPVVVVALVIMVGFHGIRMQAEQMVRSTALLSWLPLAALCRS